MRPRLKVKNRLKKSYIDGRFGQIHLITAGAPDTATPPLYLLHATAYSGRTFGPLIQKLAATRLVFAPDTPGYGGSDRPSGPPAFKDYAAAFVDLIEKTMNPATGPVDVLGYHTGAFIALEAAALRPDLIRSLILIGIPFFEGLERDEWRKKLVEKSDLTEAFRQFEARWNYFIRDRTAGLPLRRAFECFVDELRAYPDQWWAHEALFNYDTRPCLENASCPVLVLNPDTALSDASRSAAQIMPNCSLIELPELNGAIFDLGTDVLTAQIEKFLNGLAQRTQL